MELAQASMQTLGQVMDYMASFAGGSVPSESTAEWLDWRRWIQNKQNEFAIRGFWRRLLTREALTIGTGYTTLLPARFHKPNGLYMCIVDEIDWMDYHNSDDQNIFVEMDSAPFGTDGVTANTNYARWQMRFKDEILVSTSSVIWYFAAPPIPTASSDKLILPADMVAYGALAEYFRAANQEGSMDKAEIDAENRFEQYINLEVLPAKNELLVHTERPAYSRLNSTRLMYANRTNRNTQG